MPAPKLRLGTRGSALAVAQSTTVARALEVLGETVELVTIKTSGDQRAPHRADSGRDTAETGPAARAGGRRAGSGRNAAESDPASGEDDRAAVEDKARFVKELEQALLAGEIDLAVHSAKDVPGELPAGLAIVGVPERADARDALCLAPHLATGNGAAGEGGAAGSGATGAAPAGSMSGRALAPLSHGAVVGTASLRRRAQLLALRPDLDVRELRGNVDTRLRRLEDGNLDAIVLAAAGLARLGRADAGSPLPELSLVPAPGQGCLALEARADDSRVADLASRLTDPAAHAALAAERRLVTAIGATCHTPVGAHAAIDGDRLHLRSFVGTPDGATWIRDELSGPADDPEAVGADAADRLLAAGARAILAAGEPQPAK